MKQYRDYLSRHSTIMYAVIIITVFTVIVAGLFGIRWFMVNNPFSVESGMDDSVSLVASMLPGLLML